jgi:hypothetical protein
VRILIERPHASPSTPVAVELPDDLSPRERTLVEGALQRYLVLTSRRPGPWSLGGRAEGLGLGALQLRFQSIKPWGEIRLNAFTRRGSDPRIGAGGSR